MAETVIAPDDLILITGSAGFIGSMVVENCLRAGFGNLRVFARPTSKMARLESVIERYPEAKVEVFRGNLLSREDCLDATRDAALILHLAAGRGLRSFPDAYMNSVVTTRNLLDAAVHHGGLRRFVNVSSFTVYSNRKKPRSRVLDESCPIEPRPELRGEAYCYAKVKQDEIVEEYGKKFSLRYVILRPGQVYGPGNEGITGRVGIDTFGMFLHLGGSNTIPFTHVSNCADAIVAAGLKPGIDGEIFNVVDDNLPSSRRFLRLYKRRVKKFRSIYVPHILSYALCSLWERYATWSQGQLPLAFSRRRWHADWKKTRYSNEKLKKLVGWTPKVSIDEGLSQFMECCRMGERVA
jgi:nucleoside-diphosphate-sugar epimerase